MKCPYCNQENDNNSSYCWNCGKKIDFEPHEDKIRKQTAGERFILRLSRVILSISLFLLFFSFLGLFIYDVTVLYGYPTSDSKGYYVWTHPTYKSDGVQAVSVIVTPIKRFGDFFSGNRYTRHYENGAEVKSNLERQIAIATYRYKDAQKNITLIILLVSIAILVIERYVTKICTPKP